jgi:hypothetical protein
MSFIVGRRAGDRLPGVAAIVIPHPSPVGTHSRDRAH